VWKTVYWRPVHSHADAPCGALRAQIPLREISTKPLFSHAVHRAAQLRESWKGEEKGNAPRAATAGLCMQQPVSAETSGTETPRRVDLKGHAEDFYARGASAWLWMRQIRHCLHARSAPDKASAGLRNVPRFVFQKSWETVFTSYYFMLDLYFENGTVFFAVRYVKMIVH